MHCFIVRFSVVVGKRCIFSCTLAYTMYYCTYVWHADFLGSMRDPIHRVNWKYLATNHLQRRQNWQSAKYLGIVPKWLECWHPRANSCDWPRHWFGADCWRYQSNPWLSDTERSYVDLESRAIEHFVRFDLYTRFTTADGADSIVALTDKNQDCNLNKENGKPKCKS